MKISQELMFLTPRMAMKKLLVTMSKNIIFTVCIYSVYKIAVVVAYPGGGGHLGLWHGPPIPMGQMKPVSGVDRKQSLGYVSLCV